MEEFSERRLWIIKAGIVPYEDAWYLQGHLRKARIADKIGDTLLLLQHNPVITLGRASDEKNLLVTEEELRQKGIDCVNTDRGGDVTYHGPGQLIGYSIMALNRNGITVGRYVRKLEEVIIESLKDLGVKGMRLPGKVGGWGGGGKIASIGVRVRQGVSTHGFALNVSNDLIPFQYINPCGMKGMPITSVCEALQRRVAYEDVEEVIAYYFQRLFNMKLCSIDTLAQDKEVCV